MGKGGGDSGARAAEAEAEANRQATAELRRQFEVTRGLIEPFQQVGERGIPRLEEASTIAGLESRLQEIFGTESFGSLVEERGRAVQGQLAATGQSRSGTGLQEAARVPSDLGLAIEGLLTGRTQNIVSGGQQAALGLAQAGQQTAGSIAGLLQSTGTSRGQGILTDAQAGAAQTQQTLNTIGALAGGFAGIGGVSGIADLFKFSDSKLKENIEVIGECHGLKICQWDWKEATKGTIIEKCANMGFIADEVKEKFPKFVSELCGFLVIDYPNLLDELETI